MNSSGTMRGVAATAIAALAVAGLPLLSSPAHAVLTTVDILNLRERNNFDIDEFRDGDDFRIETLDENDQRIDAGTPEYRWVLPGAVEGTWLPADPRAPVGSFRVPGPSRTGGADGITDSEIAAGQWRLEARMGPGGMEATPEQVAASESEITLQAPQPGAGGTKTVTGTLANAGGGLAGRAVELKYTRNGGDSRIRAGAPAETGAGGTFTVTLEDPNGQSGGTGVLTATSSGEEDGDLTQLPHRYGPNDESAPGADATDKQTLTWAGQARTAIAATLGGRSNGARADVVKVVAPTRAHDASVRLFRVAANGTRTLLQTRQLNQNGDKKFRVTDRNRRGFSSYVAKVAPTSRTLGDETNRRRVR